MSLPYEWWVVGTTGRRHLFLRTARPSISECGMVKGWNLALHDKGDATKCRSCLRLESLRKTRYERTLRNVKDLEEMLDGTFSLSAKAAGLVLK